MLHDLKMNFTYCFVGILIGAFAYARFVPSPKPQPSTPQIIEVIKYVKDTTTDKALKKSVLKIYDCNNGALSKETATEEEIEKTVVAESSDQLKKSDELKVNENYLEVFTGLGVQLKDVESFSDLELNKIKGQLAAGATYSGYASFAASDLKTNHNLYIFKSWRFK